MAIGIIGAGANGSAIAAAFARARMETVIANSRGPESLTQLAQGLGPSIRAGTAAEAAAQEVVIVAVLWEKLPKALEKLDLSGRIVVDANNPIEVPSFTSADLGGRLSSEVFSAIVPGARVVKAFNHLAPSAMSADPTSNGGKRVLFFSGNDALAKERVAMLIDEIGFCGIDLGGLAIGGRLTQFPGGPLAPLNLSRF